MAYLWDEHSEITHWSMDLEMNDKYEITVRIENPDQGRRPSRGYFDIFLKLPEYELQNGGSKLISHKNWFIIHCEAEGGLEAVQKACEDFYEQNIIDKDLTPEYLMRLHYMLAMGDDE